MALPSRCPTRPKTGKPIPPLQCADSPSFPLLRLGVLFSLLSGAISPLAYGRPGVSELALFGSLMRQLVAGDILLGDRGFGCYPVVALLQGWEVDFIGRITRRVDGRRRHQRLAKNDWLIQWQMGFRVRQVTLVTTLLDPKLYPAHEILQAYLRRWRLEMCLDDLKTTLKLDTLRGRSPAMAQRELYPRLIAHNLIRCLAAQAATTHDVVLERISFKGSLDALRQFSHARARARSKKKYRQLWAELLATLAADRVPARPGRREPRAVKRKKNKYPRLNVPRHKFRDRPKRNERRKNARLRRLGLM